MKVLKFILAAIVETALIIGSLYLFGEESIVFCIAFIFLLLVIPLMSYYVITEKKPKWIIIILVLLLPLCYLVNMGVTSIQEKNYDKQMDVLINDNQAKAQEMTDSLKTLLEKGDEEGLRKIYTEESVDYLMDQIDLKKIKFITFGEDLELEPYDTESWGAYGTGKFECNDNIYYIEYSISGTTEDANYSDITIIPWDLFEKASALTEESDTEEINAIYDEVDEKQIYLESIYDSENQSIDDLMDIEY